MYYMHTAPLYRICPYRNAYAKQKSHAELFLFHNKEPHTINNLILIFDSRVCCSAFNLFHISPHLYSIYISFFLCFGLCLTIHYPYISIVSCVQWFQLSYYSPVLWPISSSHQQQVSFATIYSFLYTYVTLVTQSSIEYEVWTLRKVYSLKWQIEKLLNQKRKKRRKHKAKRTIL